MVENFRKRYDVNLVYSGSYDSKSEYEIKSHPASCVAFEFTKLLYEGLCEKLGKDKIFYPQRDMLGGVNLFDEFHRVTTESCTTLIIVSSDINSNPWYRWLNQMAFKRERDEIGIKTLFVFVPGLDSSLVRDMNTDFIITDNAIHSDTTPANVRELSNSQWFQKVVKSIRQYAGIGERRVSEEAQPSAPQATPCMERVSQEETPNRGMYASGETLTFTTSSDETDIGLTEATRESGDIANHLPAPTQATDPPEPAPRQREISRVCERPKTEGGKVSPEPRAKNTKSDLCDWTKVVLYGGAVVATAFIAWRCLR